MSDPGKAVFLSYASQDAEAAKRICDALRQAGVEVWFDQSELVGGDAWDTKIKKQIKECALFVPVISANTNARSEGYFRLEWKLAVDRSHLMADDAPFLFPVVIDDTPDATARVPDKFRDVQWTRLNVKDTPETLAKRVAKLLGGGATDANPVTNPRASGKAHGRSWVKNVGMIGGILIGLIYAIRGVIEPSRGREAKPAVVTVAPGPTPPAAVMTPARQLAEKARVLIDSLDSTADDFATAEGLVKRALELEQNDGEIWAISSRLNSQFLQRNFGGGSSRREAARSQSERALKLAPDSVEVLLAVARVNRGPDAPRAEAALRQALVLAPRDGRVLLNLGSLYRVQNRPDEAMTYYERAAAVPDVMPLARYDQFLISFYQRKFAEADRYVRAAAAALPSANFVTGQAMLELTWRGQPDAALRVLATAPGKVRAEPRSVIVTVLAAQMNHQPEAALAALGRFPADYVSDAWYTGPKALLVGLCEAQAGRPEAARVAWESGIALLRQRLQDTPNNPEEHLRLGELFAWSGQTEAALGEVKIFEQLTNGRGTDWTFSAARIYAALGRADAAVPLLANELVGSPAGRWPLTPALLRLDPIWDKIRDDPRFQKLAVDPMGSRPVAGGQETEDGGRRTVDGGQEPVDGGPSFAKATDGTRRTVDSRPIDQKSVAVLAFANLSDDRGNEYFSDGISEELLNVLAKVPGLKVSARTSAFYFKGKEVPIPEIARQLGVAYVVEGSVRKAGDKVRITAQLIKAADGFHVWSDTFTRDLKDVFAVQDEIAGLIAKTLELKLGIGSAESRREVNPEAHRLVLEGRHFLAPRSAVGFEQAERAFTAALKLDPQFAPAQAGLASTTALRGRYRLLDGVGRVEEFDQQALAQSRRALQLDPTLAEPHATIGFVYTDIGRLAEAEQEFQLAIAANPNFATAYHWHSHVLAATGRLDLALQEIGRGEALDPVSFIILYIRGFYLLDARRYAEALAVLDRAAAIRGESFLPLESDRARALLALGRKEEALATARQVLQDPRLITSGWYAAGEALYVLHQGGAADEAVRLAPAILQALPAGSYQRGYVHCALGNFAEGLGELAHIPDIVQSRLYWHPMLESIHDTPQFRQLLEKLNAVAEFKVARATLARMLAEPAAGK